MATDYALVFFSVLLIVIDVPLVILIALDRWGTFRIFGNKPKEELRKEEQDAQQA